ncbi:unnamed protein product [Prunus armeniaca]
MSHGYPMSFTRDALLFKSRVRGTNSEVGAQIAFCRICRCTRVVPVPLQSVPPSAQRHLAELAPQPIGTGGPAGLRVAPGRGGDDKA